MEHLVFVFALVLLLGNVTVTWGSLSASLAHFVYPSNIRSERDLPLCSERAVCSLVHRRFWGAPPLVERLCRCPGRLECPAAWKNPTELDELSMHLNTRSQFKFCRDVSALKRCSKSRKTTALSVTTRHEPPDLLIQASATETTLAQVTCFCAGPPVHRHWHPKGYQDYDYGNGTLETVSDYACAKLPRCVEGERCGVVRADLFSAFYHCSCLRGSLCVFSGDEPPHNVSEVLFTGLAYHAHCTPSVHP